MDYKYKRRESAIVYADVVAFSRLTQKNEAEIHQRLIVVFDRLLVLSRQSNGRVLSAEGDSFLAEFPNAIDGLNACVKLQAFLDKFNATSGHGDDVTFRYGINFGDVNIDESTNTIFGTTVNTAARLESLSSPSCVCITESTLEKLPDVVASKFYFQGCFELKNIRSDVRVFKLNLGNCGYFSEVTANPELSTVTYANEAQGHPLATLNYFDGRRVHQNIVENKAS